MSTIERIMDNTEGRSKLDASVKKIFTIKPVIARMIHLCVPEYMDCTYEEIEGLIEGDVHLNDTPLMRDSKSGASRIQGSDTLDKTLDEGTIAFDVKFEVALPPSHIEKYKLYELESVDTESAAQETTAESSPDTPISTADEGEGTAKKQKKQRLDRTILRSTHMAMNFEGQGVFRPGYPVIPRGEFYGSRMVSMQVDTAFEGVQYGQLEKTYSIWVFMNTPKKWKNLVIALKPTLQVISTGKVNTTDEEKQARLDKLKISPYSYGLVNVVMVCLGDADDTDVPLLKLLDTIVPDDKTKEEKLEAMRNDGIAITERTESIVENMYSFSDYIEARGENIRAVSSIREWMDDSGGVSESVFSRLLHITLAQFQAVIGLLTAHRDWDDKKIASEIDWTA